MAAPPGPAPAPAPAPGPADEIRGLHLLYVKEVAAAASSSLAASPAAAAGGAAAAAGGAAAPGAPAPAGGAADLPELYVGKDNKLYGIDGTQLVRINVDAGNLVRVADAAAHSEKKDGDEELITEKGYKSAETAAVRHARKALATLESRFPIIKNIADLRKKLEECCSGIAAAHGAAAASAAGAVDVNGSRSVVSGGTEESKEGEEEENGNNGSRSVVSGGSSGSRSVAAAEPNPRKPQSGGARNRRVTPIGKKIGGISLKKRTPKKKSRSKK